MAGGPITVETSSLALGLAQIRVGPSATHIGKSYPVLSASDSIGSLTQTDFSGNTEWWEHYSGFPQLKDYSIPLKEDATLTAAYEEITPYNIALANGIDPTGGGYADAHSGEIALGGKSAPAYVRMEAVYTYPDAAHYMTIIFPRAQIKSNLEVSMNATDSAKPGIEFISNIADSNNASGHACWDGKPLGVIQFT